MAHMHQLRSAVVRGMLHSTCALDAAPTHQQFDKNSYTGICNALSIVPIRGSTPKP